jgi:hypothetical protein
VFRVCAAVSSVACVWAAHVLHAYANADEGNVAVNETLAAMCLMVAATLVVASTSNARRNRIELRIFELTIFVLAILAAAFLLVIANASGAPLVSVIALTALLPLLGLASVITIVIAVVTLVGDRRQSSRATS